MWMSLALVGERKSICRWLQKLCISYPSHGITFHPLPWKWKWKRASPGSRRVLSIFVLIAKWSRFEGLPDYALAINLCTMKLSFLYFAKISVSHHIHRLTYLLTYLHVFVLHLPIFSAHDCRCVRVSSIFFSQKVIRNFNIFKELA